jgi:Gpi18-like mannosyltransferase
MATGYLTGSGLDPYQHFHFADVFSHPSLQLPIPRFGYPPFSALILGLAFQLSFKVVPNLILYNFAIKVPIIAANICLAYLVRHIIVNSKSTDKTARFAFLFLLFNPFTLLTTSAWGQYDTIVTLLCIASLYLLSKGKTGMSVLILALSFSIKPITLPLLALPLFLQKQRKWKTPLQYLLLLGGAIFLFFVFPFLITGWQPLLASDDWNAHFRTAGGLTMFGVMEIINDTQFLPQSLEILGFLWMPALLISYYSISRSSYASQDQLFRKATLLIMVFFLTRSWLSEPNINLLLPLMLITLGTEKKTFFNFHFIWSIPIIFMFLNYSIPQLFFIPYPAITSDLAALDLQIRTTRLIGRLLVAGIWQVFAGMLLYRNFVAKKQDYNSPKT